jgi:hypothetical protein
MKRHKWHDVGNGSRYCPNCRKTRRRGKGPRGGTCWEYREPRVGNQDRWAQYTSGNDPKCEAPR